MNSYNTGLQDPPQELQNKCLQVLDCLMAHEHGWVFNAPVDPIELQLPDYFQVVKKPMDLGSIKKRLENGCYHDIKEFEAEVNLTFDNATLYNINGSVVHNMAKEMKQTFKQDFKKLLSQLSLEDEKRIRRNSRESLELDAGIICDDVDGTPLGSMEIANSKSFKHHNEYAALSSLESSSLAEGTDGPTQPIDRYAKFRCGHYETILVALTISPFWFLSNYFYNLSLSWTSVTSSTVCSSTGSIFTFLIGLKFGDEIFSWYAVVGVLLAVFGSASTAFGDAAGDQADAGTCDNAVAAAAAPGIGRRALGDAAGLAAALGYGIYCTMIRVRVPSDGSMSIALVFGYIGLINTAVLGPLCLAELLGGGLAAHLTWEIFGTLVLKGLLDNVVSDWLWAQSVILTSATVATVGMCLTVPIAFSSDFLLWGIVPNFQSVLGASGVLLAFLLLNYSNRNR